MKTIKPEYGDRALMICRVYYCLCTSEAMYYAELKRLDVAPGEWRTFVMPGGDATTHNFTSTHDRAIAIVTLDMRLSLKYTPIQVAAMLVHEAVHIWQRHCRLIGSGNDHGDEDEAYAIQCISQSLMVEYERQMLVTKRKRSRG